MLSKQPVDLAKQQLDLAYQKRKAEFDEINKLTNPVIKKKLLEAFADSADSAAVDLKAAALPRQAVKVLLPSKALKDTEIYAPTFNHGEKVVLIRHPHGGTFEIPELTVNNKQLSTRKLFGNLKDAVAINANVAARLSGADFDGDTVLVIPNNKKLVKTSRPLKGLEGFDPKTAYPGYEGMKRLEGKAKQKQMGEVSNLITDMTIKGATAPEIARAVRHSMVVIDAEKWNLNHKQSFVDNGIKQLKDKYQSNPDSKGRGASTLISRASSEQRVAMRKPRKYSEGGPIDPVTGEKIYTLTGETYTDSKGRVVTRTTRSTKMAETRDARALSSGTAMESEYASHANKLKALGNKARLQTLRTPRAEYNPSAAKAYSREVAALNKKLGAALQNKPLERQAQLIGRAEVNAKKKANPDMDGATLKKLRNQAITKSRVRTGASKSRVDITPNEWKAIQAGAISHSKLEQILAHTDNDVIKQYATPRTTKPVSTGTLTRARAMERRGYTQAEIASQLGVSESVLAKALQE